MGWSRWFVGEREREREASDRDGLPMCRMGLREVFDAAVMNEGSV